MCMNVAKDPISIYRWNMYIFFLHFAVVIWDNQYDEFLFFNCTKNSPHLKIMVLGLRGPAGGPCKSEDITGWGLKDMQSIPFILTSK